MRKYLKEAFSLAELAIVLTLIGIFAAVVVPIVFHLMPDTDLVKFKKANITLGKAISEVVSSGKYFSPGDLGKDPEGNFITNPKLLCAAMADVMSIKSSACSDNDLGYNTSAVANMVNLSTDEVLAGVKLSDYADCMCAQNISSGPEIVTVDDVTYYIVNPKYHFGSIIPGKDKRLFNPCSEQKRYKYICLDIDGQNKGEPPFGYALRNDGKIIYGSRAKVWLKRKIQNTQEAHAAEPTPLASCASSSVSIEPEDDDCVLTQDGTKDCENGYYYDSNFFGCQECHETCANCNSGGEAECSECYEGWYLSGSSCIPCPFGCSVCSGPTTCQTCEEGYHLVDDKCEPDIENCKDENFIQIGSLCVTKRNMGDSAVLAIPSKANVTVSTTGSSCGAEDDYTTKCCWQGATSGSKCDSANGTYSGCDRTVCNWAAANAICEKFRGLGLSWRLASTSEMSSWGLNSIGLKDEGLRLCDLASGNSSSRCGNASSCSGAYDNSCDANSVWGENSSGNNASGYFLNAASWTVGTTSKSSAVSVRCVSDGTEAPLECEDNEYKNDAGTECLLCSSAIPNCVACDNADTCTECEEGYELKDGKCEKDLACDGDNFMVVDGLCVTKINIGDSVETGIPVDADVTIVASGASCTDSKCCWQGATADYCNSYNVNYSGCNRTVCNWAAAKELCDNFSPNGRAWRLPTTDEMVNWGTNSVGKGNNGLKLCDSATGGSITSCESSNKCLGAKDDACHIGYVWSSVQDTSPRVYSYYLSGSVWNPFLETNMYANSVRCVSDGSIKCPKNCLECDEEGKCTLCEDGYDLVDGECKAGCGGENFMRVGSLCVTRRNMGDATETDIPLEANITIVEAGESCTDKKCCWQGSTSGDNCDSINGSYSGCNRTVCTWDAASAICAYYSPNGSLWRLPLEAEMTTWGNTTNSLGKGDEGLMLCDYNSGFSSSLCSITANCISSTANTCYPERLWTSAQTGTEFIHYYLNSGSWASYSLDRTFGMSIRCVSDGTPHCGAGKYYTGSSCANCPTNCATCNGASSCTDCKDGFKLANGACVFDCSGDDFMKIGNLCVTRRNMNDSTKLAIPSAAGVTLVNTGSICGAENDYSTKCCWQGETSGTTCDATNGSYSGCDRTVCNWAAADAICANFSPDGQTWRLPTATELASWGTNSIGLADDGLMLCDTIAGYSSARCGRTQVCSGAYGNFCFPYRVWSSTAYDATQMTTYNMDGGWATSFYDRTGAYTFRCVRSL